jgi:hypothetical protein
VQVALLRCWLACRVLTGSNFTRSGHFREFVEGSGAAKMTIPGVHAEFVLPRLTFWMNA